MIGKQIKCFNSFVCAVGTFVSFTMFTGLIKRILSMRSSVLEAVIIVKALLSPVAITSVFSLIIFLILKTDTTVIIYKFSYVIFAEILSLVRKIKIFNLSNSKIVNKSNQCEFNAIREVTLNVGRVTGYTLLLLAGLTQSAVVLNIVTIILTLSLLVMSINLTKVKKNSH